MTDPACENGIPIKVVLVDCRGRTHGSVDAPEDIIEVEGELVPKGGGAEPTSRPNVATPRAAFPETFKAPAVGFDALHISRRHRRARFVGDMVVEPQRVVPGLRRKDHPVGVATHAR